MTKKYFIKVAKVVSEVEDNLTRWRLASQLAEIFKSVNPRFDSEKFRAACNPEGGEQ